MMTEKQPQVEIEEPPRAFNPAAPCRVVSSESNLLGECMRCGLRAGEVCREAQR
jgi:hypothetical protein